MNEKKVKKLRQIYKKKYHAHMLENTEILNKCLKKKPKYCPKKLWSWGVSIFFDVKMLEKKLKGE